MRKGRETENLGGYDWITASIWISLLLIGWLMIYAAGYNEESPGSIFDFGKTYGKQLIWIGVGLGVAGFIQLIETRFYFSFAPIFYAIACLLLIAVLFTKPINGATSWFDIGGFRFQPSEFSKTATCIMLALFLSEPNIKMKELKTKLWSLSIVGLPLFLILLQGDVGSALVFSAFLILLFRTGLDAFFYVFGLAVAGLSIAALLKDDTWWLMNLIILIGNMVLLQSLKKNELWLGLILLEAILSYVLFSYIDPLYVSLFNAFIFLILAAINVYISKWEVSFFSSILVSLSILFTTSVNYIVNNLIGTHRQERIWVWLRPEKCNPLGPLYNVEQSKFAIGSGGWFGKGFLEGERTKLDYVPEQSTDFIFCTVGEEWGFLGSFIIISLFMGLLIRILYLAERQRSAFSKYYILGVACILLVHVFINIGMTTGLVPVIGIPLPFISYGGSSLISFSILIGLLLKLDSERLTVFR